MLKPTFFICLLFCLTAWKLPQKGVGKTVQNRIWHDSTKTAIILYDSTCSGLFDSAQSAILTLDDLQLIDSLFGDYIALYNARKEKEFIQMQWKSPLIPLNKDLYVINLERPYYRQYVAIINVAGEKEVWINCMCAIGSGNWKKQIIRTKNGGNCYFNLKINLTQKIYYDLIVNKNS